ncbi:hypothetical protein [Microvirga yunnanensis]|uniref:hypothetical protein n=1 Tax=Microvirga yunnanensis TaxID=2953740 RepID=UPI0021CA3982|nr:hypothetical protein [Microvirga sp. HBU67655]
MTLFAFQNAARMSMRLFGNRTPEGERSPALVHPANSGEAFEVEVIFDRQARDRTVLNIALPDAVPKMWTLTPEAKPVMCNEDVIELRGERWMASSRFEGDHGFVEYVLYEAP